MPRVLRPCKTPACPRLVNERTSYCTSCEQRGTVHPTSDYRAMHNAMYDQPEWRRYTKKFKASHPLCTDPYHRHVGETCAMYVVDHIQPHCGNRALFWNPKNHQPLCEQCHNWKSAIEKHGADPRTVPARIAHASVNLSGGIITDPRLVGRVTKKRLPWNKEV
jgi:5-methylcytosine-specific restriction protein A